MSDKNSMIKELSEVDKELDNAKSAILGGKPKSEPEPRPAVVPSVAMARTSAKESAQIREMSREIEEIKKKLDTLDEVYAKLEMLEDMEVELNYIKHFLDTKLDKDFEAMYHNILEQMNVEAIKIYRNVQAVIVEEDAKQNHVLFGVDGKSDRLKFRMNNVMIFSIVSFIVSIVIIIMQILPHFGISLF